MVHSYIDTEFVKFFLRMLLDAKTHSKESEVVDRIRKHFIGTDLVFQSDFMTMLNDFNEYEKDLLKRIFFNELTTGRGDNKVEINHTRAFNLLRKKSIYSALKQPFANYWINGKSKYNIEEYQNSNPYFFFNSVNFINNCDFIDSYKAWWVGRVADINDNDVLGSWNDLEVYKHNYFDIIISDKYCLSDKDRIKKNIPYIVKSLSSETKNIKNILVFIKSRIRRDSFENENTLKEYYDILMEEFTILGMENVKLKIFASRDTTHDRFIVTNSFYLYSGQSLNYFPQNKLRNNGETEIRIESISKEPKIIKQRLRTILKIYSSNSTVAAGTLSDDNILYLYSNIFKE